MKTPREKQIVEIDKLLRKFTKKMRAQMVKAIKENPHGWRGCITSDLQFGLDRNAQLLREGINDNMRRAANVANFAMMIFDHHARKEKP